MPTKKEWKLIGLVGASGAGKTSIAETLQREEGFYRLHMGQPIKDMLSAFGLNDLELRGPPEVRAQGSAKLAGKSPRFAMQTLGTDWGREMISKRIWANHLKRRLAELRQDRVQKIIVDDLRFPEDFDAILDAGGMIVRVVRPDLEVVPSRAERMARRLAWLRRPFRILGLSVDHETEVHWRTARATFEIENGRSVEAASESLLETYAAALDRRS